MQWLLGAWILALAAWDLRYHRIPNLALLPVAILIPGSWMWVGHGPLGAAPLDSALGAALSAAFWLPGWLAQRSGGGDLKLAVLLGLLLGVDRALEAALTTALLLGLVSAIVSHRRTASAGPSSGLEGAVLAAAPMLAAGFLIQLAGGPWWLPRIWNGG
ncbi:MAG TPA: prepilin peptidase [Solimonas sp.]|nr:prepilin peptidase [Solimonas sp.]